MKEKIIQKMYEELKQNTKLICDILKDNNDYDNELLEYIDNNINLDDGYLDISLDNEELENFSKNIIDWIDDDDPYVDKGVTYLKGKIRILTELIAYTKYVY